MSNKRPDAEPLLQFPCSFPIKMMGRDKPRFRETVVAIVARHAGDIAENAIRTSSSSKRAYLSVTVTIDATSQDQLDRIYQDLSDHEDVIVSL